MKDKRANAVEVDIRILERRASSLLSFSPSLSFPLVASPIMSNIAEGLDDETSSRLSSVQFRY